MYMYIHVHVGILLVPGVDQAKIIIIILCFAGQLSGKVREWHLHVFLSLYIN